MTYQEFGEWCNERTADGQWDFMSALWCTQAYSEIINTKVKGLFKKRATEEKREEIWNQKYREYAEEIVSDLNKHYHY